MANNNGNNNRPPKKRITLTLTEPSDGTFTATATASEGQNPLDDAEIIFMVNGKKMGEAESVDENGVAVKSINLEKGSYSVSAMIQGTSYAASKLITIKGAEKKTPSDLQVVVSGHSGDFTISVQVLDSSKNGIKEAAIQIIDQSEELDNRIINAKSDEYGSYVFPKTFTDKNRVLGITVKGTQLKWQRTLWGPENNGGGN